MQSSELQNGWRGFFLAYKRCIKEFDSIRGKRYCVGVGQKILWALIWEKKLKKQSKDWFKGKWPKMGI